MSTSIMDWMDKRCIACKGPMPQPTWSGQPYICCSGNDCGCGGGRLPLEFCSVDCWENYEPEPDEQPEPDGECYRGGEAAGDEDVSEEIVTSLAAIIRSAVNSTGDANG